jgi:hypothetical protein
MFNADGLTDEKGNFLTKYSMNEIYETGKYMIVFWASAEGYRPKATSAIFETLDKTYIK